MISSVIVDGWWNYNIDGHSCILQYSPSESGISWGKLNSREQYLVDHVKPCHPQVPCSVLKGQIPEDKTLQESDSSGFESRGKIGVKNENNPEVYNEIFQVQPR